ncbi:helix-turn-helix transcriptional regulator [Aestuariirhabdus sp. Z084]|uniref:winged helix-turn-helix transcriptional regulator n=1 Tax=Aestuariirhabdus haliotis TaxID=2918751 RepID=UPI00201B4269|nr:helix-turn-helix domain-containing protein [Aestuariirhabdus haliotis]MCL6417805.1 helix-turn-helix transcriptional regulator [Aestuariirhabdus haliotis]MCL6421730.1 helix-turn-helix transcriptional regulator [Aestuariirhabdus haliotis]
MTRVNFSHQQCSIAQCLSAVGDVWSFLIIRDAMAGKTRFSDFEKSLGIAKNILRNRLCQLVENEVMQKVEVGKRGSRYEYQLSQKGKDLFPIMVTIYQWAENWVDEEKRSAFLLTDQKGNPINKLSVIDEYGNDLTYEKVIRQPKVINP